MENSEFFHHTFYTILRDRDMLDYIKYDSMWGYVGSWHGTTLVWVTLDYYVPVKNKLNIFSDLKCACSSLCIKNEAPWKTIECECKQH